MNLLFLLASIGVLNGFVVSIYMLFKKDRSIAEFYFGGLLFVLSIRIGKSILFYFDRDTDFLVRQIGLSFCLFIGPLFYFFLINKIRQNSSSKRLEDGLLIGLAIAIVLVGIIFPYRTHPNVWNGVIIYFIYGTWILFTLMALGELMTAWKGLSRQSSKFDQFFLIAIIIAYLFITLTYQLALFTGTFYIWGSVIFTVSFYVLFARLLTRKKEVLPKMEVQPIHNASDLMLQVRAVMENEKLFLNSQLKLEHLANSTNLSKYLLSRLLNESYPHGFSQFIKEYRVAEAKHLIIDHPEWSLEGIGQEAGFSSRSSFFEAFKKVESMTPAMYKKSQIVETSPE